MKIREIAEKIILIVLAIIGIGVSIIDFLPFEIHDFTPKELAEISLFILGTITVFVFMEVSRLHVIDNKC